MWILRRGPTNGGALDTLRAVITSACFTIAAEIDATANTRPSYDTIAPLTSGRLSGASVMRLLHEAGYLHYLYLALTKA